MCENNMHYNIVDTFMGTVLRQIRAVDYNSPMYFHRA
jgi:hypothetical protein